jgi:hypothetical protein
MSVEYVSSGLVFRQSRCPGTSECFSCIRGKPFHLGKLRGAERGIWMERFQRRIWVRVRHVNFINLCVPIGLLPERDLLPRAARAVDGVHNLQRAKAVYTGNQRRAAAANGLAEIQKLALEGL